MTAGIPSMVGLIGIVNLNQNSGIRADILQLRTYTHSDMSKLDWVTRLEDEKAAASVPYLNTNPCLRAYIKPIISRYMGRNLDYTL